MVVHGEGDHAQEEAERQEQTAGYPDGSADAIVEHLDHLRNHAVPYGIYETMSRIIKGCEIGHDLNISITP